MKNLIKTITLVTLLLSAQVFAHTKLESSIPKSGAMLMTSPKSLQLNFSDNIRLMKVMIMASKGKHIDVNFKPSATAQKLFNIDLPNLAADTYKVTWTSMGSDGHKLTGKLSFMVH
ncbi:MAG: copper resistance protein CopC [Thalassotalea sp.]|nr:copper resistance protein CopC [Thalassotalea sp.]